MKSKHIKSILTGTIVGGALFLCVTAPIFADDAPVSNLYNNPALQSIIQSKTQSTQWYNGNNTTSTQLHNALKEHAVIGGITFIARYENSQYTTQLQQQVQQNTDQITTLIGQLYGQNRQNEFKTLWVNHINLLNQYTDARKMGSGFELDQINQQIQDTINKLTDFFAQNNPSQRDEVQRMLTMHVDEEKQIIDTHAARRDGDLINLFIQAANHTDLMAYLLVQLAPHPSPTYMYHVQ